MRAEDKGDDFPRPGFCVFDLPFLHFRQVYGDKSKKAPVRRLHPVLAVRLADGSVVIPDETLMWARQMIDETTDVDQIRRRLSTVGRLSEFVQSTAPDRISQEGMIDNVVWAYLCARAETPRDIGQRVFPHWNHVGYEWVKTEFRDLVQFAIFCRAYTGSGSVMGRAFRQSSTVWAMAKRTWSRESFFSHLDEQRAHWGFLFGEADVPTLPPSLKRLAVNAPAPKSGNDTALSTDQINTVIDREQNLMFRALWILLAWCGPRYSEALNMYHCDFVDPDMAKKLFRADFNDPVPIFADPKSSTFLGRVNGKLSVQNRTEYLKTFGLIPRPDHEGKNQRAGWKGMAVFEPNLRITHGTWTCRQRAAEFADLFAHIRRFHGEEETYRRHPYLFVNYRNEEHLGEPLKIPNVRRALASAFYRAGIEPHTPGASLHGLRHFYTWYARHVLKLEEPIVQLMLRHRSVTSNRVYGKRASDLHHALSENLGAPE